MAANLHPMPLAVRNALEAYALRLRGCFGARLRELRLYGSFARGDAHEESDVDVLVLVDDLRDEEMGQALGEAAYVSLETGLPLSPLVLGSERYEVLRQEGRALTKDLEEEGIRL